MNNPSNHWDPIANLHGIPIPGMCWGLGISMQIYHMLPDIDFSPLGFIITTGRALTLVLLSFSVSIMGITESKILSEKLATACSNAEQSKQSNIRNVLSDELVSTESRTKRYKSN